MILNSKSDGTTTNFEKTASFRISANKKMFEILSSKLYSNPPAAIIRELSTNANDSHIGAGVIRPIDVHLPNAVEPWFSVQDYGLGLSHEEVTEIFTVYGESTKDESNDFNGALGLGSKSPFGYTDQFTVVSIKNGTKNSYICYLNDGFPDINLSTSEATDEANGVTVLVPVHAADISKFRTQAARIYSFFESPPNITNDKIDLYQFVDLAENVSRVTMPAAAYHDQMTGLQMSSRNAAKKAFNRYGNYDQSAGLMYIVQSNVAYPLKFEEVLELLQTDQSGSDNVARILHLATQGHRQYSETFALVFRVDNGLVSFVPSREELTYDEMTKDTILKLVNTFVSNYFASAEQAFETLTFSEFAKTHLETLNRSGQLGQDLVRKLITKKYGTDAAYATEYHSPSIVINTKFGQYDVKARTKVTIDPEAPATRQFVILNQANGFGRHSMHYNNIADYVCMSINEDRYHGYGQITNSSDAKPTLAVIIASDPSAVATVVRTMSDAANADVDVFPNKSILVATTAFFDELKKNKFFSEVLLSSIEYGDIAAIEKRVVDAKFEAEEKRKAIRRAKAKARPKRDRPNIVCYRMTTVSGWTHPTMTAIDYKEAIGKVAVIGNSNAKYQEFTDITGGRDYNYKDYKTFLGLAEKGEIFIFTETSYNRAVAKDPEFEVKPLQSLIDGVKNSIGTNDDIKEALYLFNRYVKEHTSIDRMTKLMDSTVFAKRLELLRGKQKEILAAKQLLKLLDLDTEYTGKYKILDLVSLDTFRCNTEQQENFIKLVKLIEAQ